MSESSWYETSPPRHPRRVPRRDLLECAVAALLLTGLLGLLAADETHDGVDKPDSGTSAAP